MFRPRWRAANSGSDSGNSQALHGRAERHLCKLLLRPEILKSSGLHRSETGQLAPFFGYISATLWPKLFDKLFVTNHLFVLMI